MQPEIRFRYSSFNKKWRLVFTFFWGAPRLLRRCIGHNTCSTVAVVYDTNHEIDFQIFLHFVKSVFENTMKDCLFLNSRTWNRILWNKLFDMFLNIPSCDDLPSLAAIRQEFQEYFESEEEDDLEQTCDVQKRYMNDFWKDVWLKTFPFYFVKYNDVASHVLVIRFIGSYIRF